MTNALRSFTPPPPPAFRGGSLSLRRPARTFLTLTLLAAALFVLLSGGTETASAQQASQTFVANTGQLDGAAALGSVQ